MKDPVYRYIEETLGPISALVSGKDEDGETLPFQIAFVPDCPEEGVTTLVTVGMSEMPLKQEDGTEVRHELVFCAYQHYGTEGFNEIMKMMGFMGQSILRSGDALAFGDVMDLGGDLLPGSPLTAIYYDDPLYFPEEFDSLETVDPPVVFAWMVPVTTEEADFIEEEGPDAFDKLLEVQEPDLIDLMRDPVALRLQ